MQKLNQESSVGMMEELRTTACMGITLLSLSLSRVFVVGPFGSGSCGNVHWAIDVKGQGRR